MFDRCRSIVALAFVFIIAAPDQALAWIQIEGPAGSRFAIGALIQPQLSLVQEAPGVRSRALRFSPTLRRARILMSGQVTPLVGFFFDTDASNVGLDGDWTPRVLMQDAMVEFDFLPEVQVDLGHFIVPFSHIAMQGAGALLGIDYAQLVVQQPPSYVDAKGVEFPATLSWRDVGAMVRGQALRGLLEYRLAITQGVSKFIGGSSLNPRAWPRGTGRLVYNFFDSEGAPTAGLTYLQWP